MDAVSPNIEGSNGHATLNGAGGKPKVERIQIINDEKQFTFVSRNKVHFRPTELSFVGKICQFK